MGNASRTALVESTVNQLVSKRMVKRQQMQWTGERGAPIATNAGKVLNGEFGGDVPALVSKVSTRNGRNARGTQAGRVTPCFLVLSVGWC